jgi:hypothetical protein
MILFSTLDIVVRVDLLWVNVVNRHNKVNEDVQRFVNQMNPIDKLIYYSNVSIVPS